MVLSNISFIKAISLEGLGLILPHIMAIISNPKPFRLYEDAHKHLELSYIHSNIDSPMLTHYITIVDTICCRLGVDSSEKLVMPKLVSFFNHLMSPRLLRLLLYSSIWQVIIHRSGVKCFLRQFLPMLLTYLVSGTLQNISRNASIDSGSGASLSAFWSVMPNDMKGGIDWLHFVSPADIILVQQAAKVVLSRLSYPDYLGPGLCTRYIVPALLCLIGIPQLAFAACNYDNDINKYRHQHL